MFRSCLDNESLDKYYKEWFRDTKKAKTKVLIDMNEGLSAGYIHAVGDETGDPFDQEKFLSPKKLTETIANVGMEKIADRIHFVVPGAKILIVIRNQISWLNSVLNHYKAGVDAEKITDFTASLEGKYVLRAGMYDLVVDKYFKLFGRDRVHIMLLEDLGSKEAIRDLNEFLDISCTGTIGHYNKKPRSISIQDDEKLLLRQVYAASNQRLAQLLRRTDLERKGYET
jgi:hypothetical protein